MVPHPARTASTWATAASGRDGFYASAEPTDHFRTSASTSVLFAEAVAAVLATRPEITAVLDVGAGGGHLLTGLAGLRPDLALTGVDLRTRPAGVPLAVGWRRDRYDVATADWETGAVDAWFDGLSGPALVVAAEFLDDLPLLDPHPSTRCLPSTGYESPPAQDTGRAWVQRWWPVGEPEVGLSRDLAWSGLVRRLRRTGGLALMVDYGHRRPARPTTSTLAAYRDGRVVPAAVGPDRNLTAHVAVDAVAAAGEQVGATTLALVRQRAALARWLTASDPDGLPGLVRTSERRALTETGLGDHWWLLQAVPADSEVDLTGSSQADRPRSLP